MKNNLVETVKVCFTANVINQLSQVVDEPESGVETALSESVPLVLNGLLKQLAQGVAPASLLDLVRDADAADVLAHLTDVQAPAGHERSANLLLDMLGDTYRNTVNQIAADAGIRPTASGTLLQVAATAVLGILGKFAVENNLTPSEFIHWLQSQKDAISAAMLPVVGARGLVSPGLATQRQPAASPPRIATTPVQLAIPRQEMGTRPVAPAPVTGGGVLRWQWGGLLLLAVCLGYFFGSDFFGRARQPVATAVETSPTVAAAPVVAENVPAAPAPASPVTTAAAAAAAPAPAAALLPKAADNRPANRPSAASATSSEGRYDIDRDTYVYDTGRPIVLTLANGNTQKVGANSTENRLYSFLATAAVQVDSVNRTKGWINFDRVYFEPGAATLKAQSWPQLRNIANILRSFPNTIVKVGGYTDSAGVALRNLELSEGRARTAMMALANLGVPLDRLQAKGYGSRYFVAPNSTPAGRALNRRVSIRVVKK